MVYDISNLPDDSSQLKRIVVALLESDAAKQKTLDDMVAEIAKLNVTVQKLTEMLFGKKNKKLDNLVPEEPTISETETQAAETPEYPALVKERKKKEKNGGGGRNAIPDNIPVTITENEPPLSERTCAECDKPFKNIGFEVSRKIVYVRMLLLTCFTALDAAQPTFYTRHVRFANQCRRVF